MKRFIAIYSTKKCLSKILAFFLLGIFLPSAGGAELVDKVVAVVNDEVITLSEVEEETERIFQTLAKESSGQALANSMAEAREATLNGLIDRRLINQRAKLTNITVTDEELAAALDSTRNRMALNPTEFRKKLERSGMTEETLKKQLRDQVLQSKIVSLDVRAKIVVTDEMIRNYYNEQHTAKTEKGNLYLLQMGFQWNPEVTEPEKKQEEKAEAKKRADRALELVNEGQDFKATAKELSDLPSAIDGGDLGILNLDDLAPSMRTAIAALQPGELSKIIETSDGYQFFKLLSAKDESVTASSSYEKAKDEIREKLYEEKLKAAYSDWVKKLKESAYIQKL
ncbi:MAG: SurA N-terminal domain-containing protein [Proteobacteria bacterium]|nr:SurA N-terminal domain-containing protein [Pseudomonadota bacterium]